MQSDTFLNDTDSDDEEYSSDSSGDLPKNNNIGVFYKFPKEDIQGERFIDQSLMSTYEEVRGKLFSKPIVQARLCIDSNNYSSVSNFNSSNYFATFADIKSVIGFTLKKLNSMEEDNRIYFSELEAKIKFIARNMKIKRVVK